MILCENHPQAFACGCKKDKVLDELHKRRYNKAIEIIENAYNEKVSTLWNLTEKIVLH